MSAVTRPRGPLPARVYWARRAVLLGIALVLVLVLGKVLGGSSDGESDGGGEAEAASGEQTTQTAPRATGPSKARKHGKPKRVLAQPDGPCDPADIIVEPVVDRTPNDGDVRIQLALTGSEPACTWTASPDSVVVKITSGSDNIWSSQQCPGLEERDVVVRSAVATHVVLVWNGRRSEHGCTDTAAWAKTGYYHVTAAALGGEPTEQQFQLTRPPAERVTVPPSPTQKSTQKSTRTSGAR